MVKHSVEWLNGEGLGGTLLNTNVSISANTLDTQHPSLVWSIGEESLGARIIEFVVTMQSTFHPFYRYEITHMIFTRGRALAEWVRLASWDNEFRVLRLRKLPR